MPLILPARTLDTASYEISNSLRFNSSDNPILTYTPSGTSSDANKRKYTFSFWIKRAKISSEQGIINWGKQTGSDDFQLFFEADDTLRIYDYGNDFGGSASYNFHKITNRLFRDPSAWYHIFLRVDTTDGTAGDRVQLYINGVKETSFGTSVDASENYAGYVGSADACDIGISENNTGKSLGAYLSEFHYIDGTAKAHTDFGEFNDNGVWIPKKYNGGSYSTNGFFLEFKQTGTGINSSGMGADTSGNGNHFAVTNLTATDQTTDTPTNNFIVWNALNHNGHSLQEGNTFTETRNSTDRDAGAMGNIGLTRGKWYWELKITAVGSHTYAGIINIGNRFDMNDEDYDTGSGGVDGYPIYDYVENGKRGTNTGSGRSETGVVQATYGNGDILNFALDLDNNKIHYGKNGTYGESSDPANNTNGIAISDGVYYTPVVVGYGSGDVHANFGQPAFSISSGNSDAEGYGNFEYAVPSGYYSICTKNLAEYG